VEVERLDKLKASKMKEIALKKQSELGEIYARVHIDIDSVAAQEKIMALIDSGNVEPSELLANLDNQIVKAKEEALSRKDILEKVDKWMSACEEESWLEDYNRVNYSSSSFLTQKYGSIGTFRLYMLQISFAANAHNLLKPGPSLAQPWSSLCGYGA